MVDPDVPLGAVETVQGLDAGTKQWSLHSPPEFPGAGLSPQSKSPLLRTNDRKVAGPRFRKPPN